MESLDFQHSYRFSVPEAQVSQALERATFLPLQGSYIRSGFPPAKVAPLTTFAGRS
jgi:hypothetical protein